MHAVGGNGDGGGRLGVVAYACNPANWRPGGGSSRRRMFRPTVVLAPIVLAGRDTKRQPCT